jgi:hypothetical protein
MNDTMNMNETVTANYPDIIIDFAETEIQVWYRVSLSGNVIIMQMQPVDNEISNEDWSWICSQIEKIEKIVANEINN